jgi:hypothetical protein
MGGEWRSEYDPVSKRDRLGLTPDLTTRWATGNDNFVYTSLWDFKSSFTCRKILWYWTFPLYLPTERKVCCGFLSPLKIHSVGRVLYPQPLYPVASTLTTTPPRRRNIQLIIQNVNRKMDLTVVDEKRGIPRKRQLWVSQSCIWRILWSRSITKSCGM